MSETTRIALVDPPSLDDEGDLRERARARYRESLDQHTPLTGAALGAEFGRSARWGNYRQLEVREERGTEQVSGEASGGLMAGASEPGPSAGAIDPIVRKVVPPLDPEISPSVDVGDAVALEDDAQVPPWVGGMTTVAVVLVALAAALASVEHLADIARLAGESGPRAWRLPASVDGLGVVSKMEIYRRHKLGRSWGVVPVIGVVLGLAVSVAGNIVSVNPELVHPSFLKLAVGAWPPIALALAFRWPSARPAAGGRRWALAGGGHPHPARRVRALARGGGWPEEGSDQFETISGSRSL